MAYQTMVYRQRILLSDDEKYLIAAVEGRANFLISGDSDLLDLDKNEDVSILNLRKFFEVLKQA